MTLPAKLSYSGHKDHALKLVVEKGKYNCTQCNKINLKWEYQCEMITCKVNLDLNCAIVDLYGMSELGINLVQLPTRGKHILEKVSTGGQSIVKHLGKNIVEGLVEGLAEGAGYDLVEAFFYNEGEAGDEKEAGGNEEGTGEEEEAGGIEPTVP
ncbi:hypothetical protein SUGI_0957420 [Cryptomeria japonica]|nr:hypothetical protein SUGI_0957420 [Cryptomeria japonica]